jgi:hypothetical protein
MALLQSHPNDPGAAGGKYRTDFHSPPLFPWMTVEVIR